MKTVKRIEIIIETIEFPHILKLLEGLGIVGYTVIHHVVGQGHRGSRPADQPTDALSNSYILVVCEPSSAKSVAETLRPILRKYGGLCLMSDVESVIH